MRISDVMLLQKIFNARDFSDIINIISLYDHNAARLLRDVYDIIISDLTVEEKRAKLAQLLQVSESEIDELIRIAALALTSAKNKSLEEYYSGGEIK